MPPWEYRLACPSCGAEIRVDVGMRTSLREHGCVICGATLAAGDFTPLPEG